MRGSSLRTAIGRSLGGLFAPPPVPVHLLGRSLSKGVAWGLLGLATVLRWLALPLAVGFAPPGARAVIVLGGIALMALLMGLQRRWPRSCAEPLRDEAVWLLGVAALAALASGTVAWEPVLLGIVGGAGGLGVAVAMVAVTWGWRPRFVEMRRPTFRILGDNPDAMTVIARVRVRADGLVVAVPRIARGPITLAVNTPTMQVVASVPFQELSEVLEREGEVRVHLGPGAPPAGAGASFHLTVEPGRYMVSVRNYLPFDRAGRPTVRVGSAS